METSWLSSVESCLEDSVSIGGVDRREESKEGFLTLFSCCVCGGVGCGEVFKEL